MKKKIELLSPAGSVANLKAAIASGADSVYLGFQKFNARDSATNFDQKHLFEAISIAKANNVRVYLTLNTLIKNDEIKDFFKTLTTGYLAGIDAVIIQDPSFLSIIKQSYPGLLVHLSTQAGIMNSLHADLFKDADRLILARELSKKNLQLIRKNIKTELEMFVHGALCVSVSGSCLFSSFIGGRSGNRGRCAQPCRKEYNDCFLLSTKELMLIEQIPELISIGIDSIKIEGRLRSPSYVANTTSSYRSAIDSYYEGNFLITEKMKKSLEETFSRGFTKGVYAGEFIFNRKKSSAIRQNDKNVYDPVFRPYRSDRKYPEIHLPEIKEIPAEKKQLLVMVHTKSDALSAEKSGADIIYLDMFDHTFIETKKKLKIPLFAKTPRIMYDSNIPEIKKRILEISPAGIFAGNLGMVRLIKKMGLDIPIHLDYNSNVFNDLNLNYLSDLGIFPIISPELSIDEIKSFTNKDFATFVHGRIILMNLAHQLPEGKIKDKKGFDFILERTYNGTLVLNNKELGLFNKAKNLLNSGMTSFYIDTRTNVQEIVSIYRNILDGKTIDVSGIKNNYVLGWSSDGVL